MFVYIFCGVYCGYKEGYCRERECIFLLLGFLNFIGGVDYVVMDFCVKRCRFFILCDFYKLSIFFGGISCLGVIFC